MYEYDWNFIYNEELRLFVRNNKDIPIVKMFNKELEEPFKHYKIKYGSNVLVIGSFAGSTEQHLFYKGAAHVTTVEAHKKHITLLETLRYYGNGTFLKTIFQKWDIVNVAVHNTYEDYCKSTFCPDRLHENATHSAFSSVENREKFDAIKSYRIKKFRFTNLMKMLFENGFAPSHIIMDFDGVAVMLLDDKAIFRIKEHGYNVLINIREKELARLPSDYFDKLQGICDSENMYYHRINKNFINISGE